MAGSRSRASCSLEERPSVRACPPTVADAATAVAPTHIVMHGGFLLGPDGSEVTTGTAGIVSDGQTSCGPRQSTTGLDGVPLPRGDRCCTTGSLRLGVLQALLGHRIAAGCSGAAAGRTTSLPSTAAIPLIRP
jgi:hypothetical protein